MKKKAKRKDFYMEIKKSFGRFLSIFFIVLLGVAFFSGIRAAEPAMRATGDWYFDDSALMDIKTISTLGITDKDVEALRELSGVAEAEGGYSADFLYGENESQTVAHIMSYSPDMNKITVSKGRLPQEAGECLADDELGLKIGDKIKLRSGTDSPVKDTLSTDTLTVVGEGNSPCYISYGRGSTSIGTGSISGFIVVPEQTFELEVYTEAYIAVAGAKELTAYTGAYDDKVANVMEEVKAIGKERGKERRQELMDEANRELAKAKQELNEGKKKAEQELSEASQKLADGESQINAAKAKIEEGKQQIKEAKSTLGSKQTELDSAKGQYDSGIQQLSEGRQAYDKGKADYDSKAAKLTAREQEVKTQLQKMRTQLDGLSRECDLLKQQIETITDETQAAQLKVQLEKMEKQLAQGEAQYTEAKKQANTEIAGYRQQFAEGAAVLAASREQLDASEIQLSAALSQIQSGQSQIEEGWSELKKQEANLLEGEEELTAKEAELEKQTKSLEEARVKVNQEILDGEQDITDAQREINKIKEPKWYVNDRSALSEHQGYGENADRMRAIGQVFPVIFFLVAALISLTAMTRMVEEQRVEIGTMKALGYNKSSIAAKYLGYALLATMGGSIAGVLLGEKALPFIIIYAYQIMYHHLPRIIVPYHLGYAMLAMLSALACTMAATLFSCFQALADNPSELMRPPAPKKGSRVVLERIPFIWNHLSFIWKSTIRNLMRYKKRFFMTVIGIGGCMALMLVGFGLRDSIMDIGTLQFEQIQTYDGTAYLQDDMTDRERTSLESFLSENPDVERFMNVYMKNITLVNGKKEREAYQCVPESADEMSDYIRFQNRGTKKTFELGDNGVILSEKTASLLGAEEGDMIAIKDDENQSIPIAVDRVCENYMGHYIYFSPSLYEKVYGEKVEYNSIYYKSKLNTKEAGEKAGQAILSQKGVVNTSYLRDAQKQISDMLKSLDMVIIVLIASAGMLAFVVLYNLNTINITERQRELATIKVLGFYDMELAAYVYRENILLTLIGAGAGMGMGKLLHMFVIETVEVDSVMFGRNINAPSFLYSLLFTVAFSLFVNLVMYFKLKKIDMVESLKSME